MYWQYRTILFEYHKDGLLGDKYIDDEEVERVLNEQGEDGWELVTVTPVQEGLLSFLKHSKLQPGRSGIMEDTGALESERDVISPPVESVPEKSIGLPDNGMFPHETQQKSDPPDTEVNKVGEIKIS